MHCKLTDTEARLDQLVRIFFLHLSLLTILFSCLEFFQERRYSKVTEGLERKLVQFETQFQESRKELEDLTGQLSKTQEALELSQHYLTTEQTQTKKLVEVKY